jgi:hypothetical protein
VLGDVEGDVEGEVEGDVDGEVLGLVEAEPPPAAGKTEIPT